MGKFLREDFANQSHLTMISKVFLIGLLRKGASLFCACFLGFLLLFSIKRRIAAYNLEKRIRAVAIFSNS